MICLPRIVFLSSFGRETSLVNIMGPRSKFPPLFTPSIYFLFFTFSCSHHYHYLMRLILSKQQGRRNWKLLCTRWEQSYLYLCAGPGELSNLGLWTAPLFTLLPTCILGVLLETISTLASSLREITATLHLKPSTWGSQLGARSHQANLCCRGLQSTR